METMSCGPAADKAGFKQPCYWYKCGQMGGGGSERVCPGGESSSDQGCGEKSRHYYAKESESFKDETKPEN